MVRVRFAPSPTGFLHIGGARTYLFNWLFAQQHGGQLVLRIDDTDLERSTDASLRSILEGLEWLELGWDEQHYQSKRRDRHVAAALALLEKGVAYRDFTPAAKIEEGQDGKDQRAGWLCNPDMRALSREESDRRAASGEPFVIRFRTPREDGGGIPFKDLVYGKQFRKLEDIEDFALLRSDGNPTYHLASCVDDAELAISHIIRGQDHLSNTYKHILIFRGLGVEPPQFGHLPLLLGPDQTKLSKRRHGPIVSVVNYRDAGFLPQGFANFLALLGWSPKDDQDVLTIDDLRARFDISAVLRANAVVQFDEHAEDWAPPKAVWLNGQHMRTMPVEKLLQYVRPVLEAAGWWRPEFENAERDWLLRCIEQIRMRFTLLGDFRKHGQAYFTDDFEVEEKAQHNLDKDNARELLHELGARIDELETFNEETAEAALRALAEAKDVKAGLLINASRAALSGQAVGPSAFTVFDLLGKDRVVRRLRNC